MRIIADFHIHSRFAMACSTSITLHGIEQAAKEKGINLIGTGDFTHPSWLAEIKRDLEPAESGLFKIKGSNSGVRFILSGEVCTLFQGNDKKMKKIHNLLLMPSIETAEAFNQSISKYGALSSDGRPILSMRAAELVEHAMRASKDAFVFPAHAWTPYFGVFGSLSGFDSMKEAYEDQEKHIYALETGLSSDSPMNWRISALDKYTLLSNSDMHSTPKIGRSANMFEIDKNKVSYMSIINAIKDKEAGKIKKTIQFFPEEGKYHFDGHRQCLVSVDPDTNKMEFCPVCGKKLVFGVVHRVNDLADRPPGYVPTNAIPYIKIVQLREVIAYVLKKTYASVVVENSYNEMISKLGTEFDILLDLDTNRIKENFGDEMSTAISNIRENKITIEPGYAGVFGKVDLLNRIKRTPVSNAWRQKHL